MSTPTPAVYELIAALDAARAVAEVAMDALPCCHTAPEMLPGINRLGNLISGVEILLKQAQQHANALG